MDPTGTKQDMYHRLQGSRPVVPEEPSMEDREDDDEEGQQRSIATESHIINHDGGY